VAFRCGWWDAWWVVSVAIAPAIGVFPASNGIVIITAIITAIIIIAIIIVLVKSTKATITMATITITPTKTT